MMPSHRPVKLIQPGIEKFYLASSCKTGIQLCCEVVGQEAIHLDQHIQLTHYANIPQLIYQDSVGNVYEMCYDAPQVKQALADSYVKDMEFYKDYMI